MAYDRALLYALVLLKADVGRWISGWKLLKRFSIARTAGATESLRPAHEAPAGRELPGKMYLTPEEESGWFERLVKAPAFVYATAIAFLLLCIERTGVTEASVPIVYFQF